jgi:hypothetical protein
VTLHALTVGVLLLTATGCAISSRGTYPADATSRPASDTPDRFMVGSITPGDSLSAPQAGGGCRNPMVDPRNGTRLTLVQSQRGRDGQVGDYEVPDGRYGARAGELLRLNCDTGRAIGFIPRRN